MLVFLPHSRTSLDNCGPNRGVPLLEDGEIAPVDEDWGDQTDAVTTYEVVSVNISQY